MYRDPGAWDALMERLVDATALYLNAQAAAGAQALQLFDSWVGTLGPDDYRRFVQPHMTRLFARLDPAVPSIHFGTDTGSLLELQRDAGGDVIGLDWRVELDAAWDRLGPRRRRPGEPRPDRPASPRSPRSSARPAGSSTRPAGRPGHIFNLGHGILPHTPVDHVLALVDIVHDTPARRDRDGSVKPTGTRPSEGSGHVQTRPPCPFGPRSARISLEPATLTMH